MTKKDKRYLRMAFIWAENSHAIRLQVGCLIVKDGVIISDGYNGTPSGFPNICEYAVKPFHPDMETENKNKLLFFSEMVGNSRPILMSFTQKPTQSQN